MKSDKKLISYNVLRWEILNRGLCFDGPNLEVLELIGVFRQSRDKLALSKGPKTDDLGLKHSKRYG